MAVEVDEGALAELAVAVWRLRNKIPEGPLQRHMLAVADALASAGVEISEYDGEPFAAGVHLRVLAFQELPGLKTERVLETVRPTVRLNGESIQIGEVIVGVPEPEADAPIEDAEPPAEKEESE